jgi:hypothetical protein
MTERRSSTPPVPLTPADVEAMVEKARGAVATLRMHPANRNGWARTAAAAGVRAARASAALDGAPLTLDATADAVTDPILAGSLRVAANLGSMAGVWSRSPLQVLARLHTLAAADLAPAAELGRPRPAAAPHLPAFAAMVTATNVPGPLQVATVHGTLLSLQPFAEANGVVARAAARLTMITTGFDARGLSVPETAYLRAGLQYRVAAEDAASGDADAVLRWQWLAAGWLLDGAAEGRSIADAAV